MLATWANIDQLAYFINNKYVVSSTKFTVWERLNFSPKKFGIYMLLNTIFDVD